jgi:DNA-binding IscR family transcriptional regulator
VTDDQIVLTMLHDLADGVNEYPLGKFSSAVMAKHPQITPEALDRHTKTLQTGGHAVIERGPDPTSRITRPTIRLTVDGITEALRLKKG